MKGFPVKSSGQLHIGIWFITLQMAPIPHDPKQGFLHFSRIHAILLGQSGFIVHSGLQFGGLPI